MKPDVVFGVFIIFLAQVFSVIIMINLKMELTFIVVYTIMCLLVDYLIFKTGNNK